MLELEKWERIRFIRVGLMKVRHEVGNVSEF